MQERTAGRRQDETFYFVVRAAPQGLENRAVLTVHGSQADMVLRDGFHHQVARRHEGFLVGQGDVLATLDGGQRRFQSGVADHGA